MQQQQQHASSSMITAALQQQQQQQQDIDIYRYLIGTWKRCLEFRQFGGLFQHLSTSNTVVVIEEFNRLQDTNEPASVRYLKWSFGKSANRAELRFGYEMKVRATSSGGSNGGGNMMNGSSNSSQFHQSILGANQVQKQTKFEWQTSGTTCEGRFYHESKVIVFNFILKASIVTVTYRIMDENTMAVSIVEVDDKQQPTIQYGNMYRL